MSNETAYTTQHSQTEPLHHRTARVLVRTAGAVLLLLLVVGGLAGDLSVLTNSVMIGMAVSLAAISLAGAAVSEAAFDYSTARLRR